MLLLDVDNIYCINMKLLEQIKYHEASNKEEKHRIDMGKELIEVKRKQFLLENFSITEIDKMHYHFFYWSCLKRIKAFHALGVCILKANSVFL